jgi:hypothetical protein
MAKVRLRTKQSQMKESSGTAHLRHQAGGRGWGPFSGGQLTTIIVTFAVLFLFPIGAWAVSGSPVFITDFHTGRHADVNDSHQLQTHPNGTQTVTGTVNATVAGTVTATPTPPGAMFHGSSGGNVNSCVLFVTPPTGEATVVTHVHIKAGAGISGSVGIYASAGCSTGQEIDQGVVASTDGQADFEFDTGLPVANGHHLYVDVIEAGGSPDVHIYSFGYNVPAGQCAAGCL